jgi:hypothetical protein
MVEVMRLVDAGGVGAVADAEGGEDRADSQIEDKDQDTGGATRISVEGPGVGGCPHSSS